MKNIVLTGAHVNRKEIHNRGDIGFSVYAAGMEKSAYDKAKTLQFVKSGRVIEMGSGSGTIIALLARAFKNSNIIGVDLSDRMLEFCEKRFATDKNISFVKGDIRKQMFLNNYADTILFCSVIHEIFSYSGYNKESVKNSLENAFKLLKPGGRLIIRGGIKPEDKTVWVKFKNIETEEKFIKFVNDFAGYTIQYLKQGNFITLKKAALMEFLSKYIYDENWDIEVKEQFGVFTLDEYTKLLEDIGFKIIHKESYLLEFLRKTHYEKDVDVFSVTNKKLVFEDYPHSTTLIVAEKSEVLI